MKMEYDKETARTILELEDVENPYQEILKICKDAIYGSNIGNKEPFYSMFSSLIKMQRESEFNKWVKSTAEYLKNREGLNFFDAFWYSFHKSMRQCDIYSGYENTKPEEGQNPDIGGHLDMLLYELIHASEVPYYVMMEVLVSKENIQKYQVVWKELNKEKEQEEA